jgi:hypothetical protein
VDAVLVAALERDQVIDRPDLDPESEPKADPVGSPRFRLAPALCSETQKARKSGPFVEAAEGTRTLDLLHGKQTL